MHTINHHQIIAAIDALSKHAKHFSLSARSGKTQVGYTSRSHESGNWRAAWVSLPVQKRGTGGLTPLRSPDSFLAAWSKNRL